MSQVPLHSLLDFGLSSEYKALDIPDPRSLKGRLVLDSDSLARLSEAAFSEIAFRMPAKYLEGLATIFDSKNASEEERFVVGSLLGNAALAAEGILPICQDTGTATMYAWKGQEIIVEGGESDEYALARGAKTAYSEKRLRMSQLSPTSMTEERNTGDNLPAAIDIRSVPGRQYRFIFAAKGGGSTSRTSLSMESPAILDKDRLEQILRARVKNLGASGCPPYTISLVLGGVSPSAAMYALELAGLGVLDKLEGEGDESGKPIRDGAWEKFLLRAAEETGIGAQWSGAGPKGGSYLAIATRAIRLSRHAANLPLALGVVCSAHRKARAYVAEDGWFMEKMEDDPARLLPKELPLLPGRVSVNLDGPKSEWLATLRSLKAGTPVELTGTVTVARDAAHARLFKTLNAENRLPQYFLDHPIFYAGPTEPAEGQSSGAFGPTTASRMDAFLPRFMEAGASLVTIAKGERGDAAKAALRERKGVYLACIGGAAALIARNHVSESRVIDFPQLGMESVRQVKLVNLPAIVAIDSNGSDMYVAR